MFLFLMLTAVLFALILDFVNIAATGSGDPWMPLVFVILIGAVWLVYFVNMIDSIANSITTF